MIMHLIIVVLVLALCALARKNYRGRQGEKYLASLVMAHETELEEVYKRVWDLVAENKAIIEGRDEQEENYEMQFLTYNEMLAEKDNVLMERNEHITELEARLEHHDRECLPILSETRWFALAGTVENA